MAAVAGSVAPGSGVAVRTFESYFELPARHPIGCSSRRGRRGIRRLCIWDVCREIRQAGLATPILFLTARTHTIDKIAGLKLGADDYVTKPFEAAELMARI